MTGLGITSSSEVVEAAVLTIVENIPFKSSLDVARDITLNTANNYGVTVINLAKRIKVGAIAVNIGFNFAFEGACLIYYLYRAYQQFKNGEISRENFERQRMKLGCESLGAFVAEFVYYS